MPVKASGPQSTAARHSRFYTTCKNVMAARQTPVSQDNRLRSSMQRQHLEVDTEQSVILPAVHSPGSPADLDPQRAVLLEKAERLHKLKQFRSA